MDLVGIVESVSEIITIKSKDKGNRKLRKVWLLDEGDIATEVALWEPLHTKPGTQLAKVCLWVRHMHMCRAGSDA